MRVRVRGVWDAEVNRGEKVIGIRKFEETERWVSFVRGGGLGSASPASLCLSSSATNIIKRH